MTQRDWQKDMDDVQGYLKNKHLVHHNEQTLRGEPVAVVLQYWLQEAKELQEIMSGRGREILRLRSLLGGLNDELTATEDRADAAEAREQKLIDIMHIIAFESDDEKTREYASQMLSTLYLDTPAPTPTKTRHACFNCDGEKTFVCYHDNQGPTIEPCEICNGEGTLLYDEEQLKHLLPDVAPKEGSS
ncbi:hypothetical protein MKY14_16080 [Paenibacillus sp. FSL R5-0887]|uniref:hypothetical protein n=1 Tax=Paenibacillus sp. FSL R5-0887 TaxID=2921662 RepID=UPI0030F90D90